MLFTGLPLTSALLASVSALATAVSTLTAAVTSLATAAIGVTAAAGSTVAVVVASTTFTGTTVATASITAATTAASVAATTAATSETTAAAARATLRSFVDTNGASIELNVVHVLNGGIGFRFLRETDETETTATASVTVLDDNRLFNGTELLELGAESGVISVPCKASNE